MDMNKPTTPSLDERQRMEQNLRERRTAVYESAKLQYKEQGEAWYAQRVFEFAEKIKKEFSDTYDQYLAYHILVGDVVGEQDEVPLLDFPEPYSVSAFYDEIEGELPSSELL